MTLHTADVNLADYNTFSFLLRLHDCEVSTEYSLFIASVLNYFLSKTINNKAWSHFNALTFSSAKIGLII